MRARRAIVEIMLVKVVICWLLIMSSWVSYEGGSVFEMRKEGMAMEICICCCLYTFRQELLDLTPRI